MTSYDPAVAPDEAKWLELDEYLQLDLVEQYHAKLKLPNVKLHAAIHTVVENQLAQNHEPTVLTVKRLMNEGVSRHDAVHAVGSLVAEHFFQAAVSNDSIYINLAQARFDAALSKLKAKDWKRR